MNYILKTGLLKKKMVLLLLQLQILLNNHHLYFFGIVSPLVFFLSIFGYYMGLFANYSFGNQNMADAQGGAQEQHSLTN